MLRLEVGAFSNLANEFANERSKTKGNKVSEN